MIKVLSLNWKPNEILFIVTGLSPFISDHKGHCQDESLALPATEETSGLSGPA